MIPELGNFALILAAIVALLGEFMVLAGQVALGLIIFAIGSIGSLIPTPSSAGGFHLLVKEAAVMTAKLNPAHAIAFATVLHFVTIIVVSLLPALVLWLYKRYRHK